MKGLQLHEQFAGELPAACRFVRWWRVENDFVDYDLSERFRSNLTADEEIGGVECLSMDEMWGELRRVCGECATVEHSSQRGRLISWVRRDAGGQTTEELPFSAESVLMIFDAETRDNPLC